MTTRTSVRSATLVLFLLCCIHTTTGGITTQHFTRPSTASPKTPSATNPPGPAAAPSWGMSSMLLLQVMDAVQQIGQYASSVGNVSSPCVRDLGVVQNGLLNKEVWALKMLDAGGKPKPGILKGQRTLVGDYNECKETAETIRAGHVIVGRFCRLDVKTNFTGLGEAASSLSTLLETISVHVCLPNSCSETDIFNLFAGLADTVPGGKLAKAECVHSKDPTGDTSFVVAVCMFAVLSLLCVVGTVTGKVVDKRNRKYEEKEIPLTETGKGEGHTNAGFDDKSNKNGSVVLAVPTIAKHSEAALPPMASGDCMLVSVSATGSGDGTTKSNGEASAMTNGTAPETDQCRNVPAEKKSDGLCTRLIMTFSVVKNGTAILNCKQGRGDLGCVHGIRVLSITWVVLGHSFAMFDNPGLGNLTDLPRAMTLWTMAPVVSGTLSVDTFFTLSGILTTYVFLRRAERGGGVGYTDMVHYYIHRFWRLTPLYMVTIVFWTCITPYLAIGPFDTPGPDIENCRTYWWHNLLYITNIADVDTMCLGWGWYLSNDMQFYVIAPIALLPWAFGKRVLGMVMCFLLLLVHVISVGVINFQENTMLFIRNTDVYMRKVYFPPWCRVGPFAIGLVLGYILFATRGKVTMSKLSVFLGWLFATAVGLTVVYVLYDNSKDMYPDMIGTWSNAEASAYEALSRPAWACAVCWVVFACCTGYGGFVNTLLSWGAWMPLSRLTYGCYMLHLIVLSVFFWNMTDSFYFSSISVTELFLAVTVISYMAAFVFALLVESPTLGVEKVVLGGGSTRGAKKAR